jgi:phage terminase small subunit
MAALLNQRHESFCHYLVAGETIMDAYEKAGFTRDAGNAVRFSHSPHIERRVAELRRGAADRLEVTQARVLAEMALIGFHNPADYLSFNDDGTCFVDLSKIDRDHAAAIQELSAVSRFDRHGNKSTEIKIKLAPKLPALEHIGRHFGMFVDRAEIGKPGDFASVHSAAELIHMVREQLGESDAQALLLLVNGGAMPETVDAVIVPDSDKQ